MVTSDNIAYPMEHHEMKMNSARRPRNIGVRRTRTASKTKQLMRRSKKISLAMDGRTSTTTLRTNV